MLGVGSGQSTSLDSFVIELSSKNHDRALTEISHKKLEEKRILRAGTLNRT